MTVRRIGETSVKSPMRRVSLLITAVLFFISITAFAVPPTMYTVYIYDGDSVTEFKTSETDADEILKTAGIKISAPYGDKVNLSGFTAEDGSAIIIQRGVSVTITTCDKTSYTVYASGTVADAVLAANIEVEDGAAMNYKAEEPLTDGMEIEIYGIYDLTVAVDKKTVKKTVSGKTVGDALSALGITLGEEDYTKPDVKTALKDNMKIAVYRVTSKLRTAVESVKYSTDYTYTDTLYKNHSKIVTDGKNGSKKVVYTDYFINGKLSSSVIESEAVIKEPVNKVVQVGTKVNPYPSSLPVGSPISEMAVPSYVNVGSNGIPTKYRSVINAKATAYTHTGNRTSTGKIAQTGYIAVDPKEIPYGTEMYIVSADGRYTYGYCIAADTGGFIYDVDWTVDLFMNSEAQCENWGRRDIIIYVL